MWFINHTRSSRVNKTKKNATPRTSSLPYSTSSTIILDHGGRAVKSPLQGRRVPSSEPGSIEEPPCKRSWCASSPSGPNAPTMALCESLERGRGLRSRHPTTVQNCKDRPGKNRLILNGTSSRDQLD
ncbi:hypothetical protein AVEN_226297-1 [Araneus ventricosus]|uniref:Uncharacterized protein n=1 Tax=Araneus ventricosus TaxID=182803 RepID=A0A4Y2DB49_ARAVE|nr:hypothetical protein AVEN_226297-1 [Araneus ventricosus]